MRAAAFICAYVVLGSMTGALVYDDNEPTNTINAYRWPAAKSDQMVGSIGAGVIWPLYWTGRIIYRLVHTARSTACG